MLAPAPASPESAGMSKAALDRLENHLKQRYVDAGRFLRSDYVFAGIIDEELARAGTK